MTNLFIDIETIPAQSMEIKERIQKKVRPPKTITKADSIAEWYNSPKYAKACDSAWEATGLNSMFGEICAIGWTWDDIKYKDDDGEQIVFSLGRDKEREDGEALLLNGTTHRSTPKLVILHGKLLA